MELMGFSFITIKLIYTNVTREARLVDDSAKSGIRSACL